jgi:hypothetical protein
MPLLEELSLSIDFTDLESESPEPDPKSLDLQLPNLKYFYLDAVSHDCAALLPWFTFNPGCVLDVRCTDSETDDNHGIVREIMSYYATDTRLDMADKSLTINVLNDTISLVVCPISPSPDTADSRLLFRFTTVLRGDDESDNGEAQDESSHYAMLAFLVRTAHLMELTECSELHLNVEVALFIEDCMAPIFGPLIRACKNTKMLVLKGTKNGFMVPFMLNTINGTGRIFDEQIFADIDKVLGQDGIDDEDELAGWDFSELLKLTTQVNVTSVITIDNLLSTLRGKTTLQAVRILHTEFDVTTIGGQLRLANFLAWRDQQTAIVDSLLWPVRSIPKRTSTETYTNEVTMADMIRDYLKPARVPPD